MNVNLTPRALRKLKAIKTYIAEDNKAAADRVISRILQSLYHLENFPLIGREGQIEGTRELSIPGLPYIGVYRIVNETEIDVLTIIHERQNYPE